MNDMSSEEVTEILPAYIEASKQFDVPVKDMENAYIGNRYSSLNACLEAVRPALQANDLVIQQGSEVRDIYQTTEGADGPPTNMVRKQVVVWSRLWHVSGQWLQSEVVLEPQTDKSGRVTPQAIGSTLSYGRRYSLKALLSLGDAEMEDDATVATNGEPDTSKQPITAEQVGIIDDLMNKSGADYKAFISFLGVKQISDLHQDRFDMAANALKRKIQANRKKGETNG